MRLALALLVTCVLADDANHVFALHDATGFAKALDGCSHFHSWADSVFWGQKIALEKPWLPSAITAALLLAEGDPPLAQVVRRHF